MWLSFNCRLTAYSLYAAVSVGLQVRIMISSYNCDKVINFLLLGSLVLCMHSAELNQLTQVYVYDILKAALLQQPTS